MLVNTGTIQIRIGGTDPAAYDRISSANTVTLGGTLDVQLINGFVPAVADVFTPLTYASRTGTFSLVNGNGHAWTPCYGTTMFRLGDPANAGFCGGTQVQLAADAAHG